MEVLEILKSYLDSFSNSNDMKRARTFYNNNKEKFKAVQKNVQPNYFELFITVPSGLMSYHTVEIDIQDNDKVTY